MEIRFISSMTAEDENICAPAILKAASALLDQLPLAYTIRIETTGAMVFQHTHVAPEPSVEKIAARVVDSVAPYGVRGRMGS